MVLVCVGVCWVGWGGVCGGVNVRGFRQKKVFGRDLNPGHCRTTCEFCPFDQWGGAHFGIFGDLSWAEFLELCLMIGAAYRGVWVLYMVQVSKPSNKNCAERSLLNIGREDSIWLKRGVGQNCVYLGQFLRYDSGNRLKRKGLSWSTRWYSMKAKLFS